MTEYERIEQAKQAQTVLRNMLDHASRFRGEDGSGHYALFLSAGEFVEACRVCGMDLDDDE